jgi:hypothetical protein
VASNTAPGHFADELEIIAIRVGRQIKILYFIAS